MARDRPFPLGVLVFTGAYLLVASIAAFGAGNTEFLFYIVTMVVLVAVVWAVDRRVRLSPASLWCLSLWGLLHMAGGLVPLPEGWPYNPPNAVLYSWWIIPDVLKYDQVVHAYGFGVSTWVVWQGLQAATGVTRPTAGLLVISGLAGMGLGAMNEVIEFAATQTMPDTNVGGYENTGWDLVANLTGVVIACLAIGLSSRRRSRTPGPA